MKVGNFALKMNLKNRRHRKMKQKTAKRFLARNNWRIVTGIGSPSFFRRVEKCEAILKRASQSDEEYLYHMFNKF
jgi:hypothetical protein